MACPTPAANNAAAYASVTAKIAELLANPRPDYTVDGVTFSFNAYYKSLLDAQALLLKQPGVAPVWTDVSVARG